MKDQLESVLRIPTKETYAYIELKVVGSAEEIIKTYLTVTDKYKKLEKEWANDKALPF